MIVLIIIVAYDTYHYGRPKKQRPMSSVGERLPMNWLGREGTQRPRSRLGRRSSVES